MFAKFLHKIVGRCHIVGECAVCLVAFGFALGLVNGKCAYVVGCRCCHFDGDVLGCRYAAIDTKLIFKKTRWIEILGYSTGCFGCLACVIYIFDKQKTITQLAGMARYYNTRGCYRLMYFEGTDSLILILIYNR